VPPAELSAAVTLEVAQLAEVAPEIAEPAEVAPEIAQLAELQRQLRRAEARAQQAEAALHTLVVHVPRPWAHAHAHVPSEVRSRLSRYEPAQAGATTAATTAATAAATAAAEAAAAPPPEETRDGAAPMDVEEHQVMASEGQTQPAQDEAQQWSLPPLQAGGSDASAPVRGSFFVLLKQTTLRIVSVGRVDGDVPPMQPP